VAFAAAVLTFMMIVGIAITRSPFGWLVFIRH